MDLPMTVGTSQKTEAENRFRSQHYHKYHQPETMQMGRQQGPGS